MDYGFNKMMMGDLYISYNDYDDFQFYDVEELSNLKNADTVLKDFK